MEEFILAPEQGVSRMVSMAWHGMAARAYHTQKAEIKPESCTLFKPAPSEPLPPMRFYLLKILYNLLKQHQLPEPVGEIFHSNHYSLQVRMEEA